jgi:hypothetical protein
MGMVNDFRSIIASSAAGVARGDPRTRFQGG